MPKPAALGFAVLFGVAGQAAGACPETAITLFCRYNSSAGKFLDVCSPAACGAPPSGWSLFAWQPFHDDKVCTSYLASKPTCDGTTTHCDEAAMFQLVYTRGCDMQRTYEAGDFPGVARTLNDSGAVFVPGGTSFVMGRDDLATVVEGLHKQGVASATDTVKYVLSVGGNFTNPEAIHSVGSWSVKKEDGTESPAADWYAMWAQKSDTHWVMDVLVAGPTATSAARIETGPVAIPADPSLFQQIVDRQASFSKAYNDGNYTALVAEFFAEHAAIIPSTQRRPVPVEDAVDFFKEKPLQTEAKMNPTIVTLGLDGSVVHEVGYAESTSSGYYARWVRTSDKDPWQMEVLCLAVFPQTAKSTELIV